MPNISGGNRPDLGSITANRPNINNRPGGITTLPGVVDRPGSGNRPGTGGNRPDWGSGALPGRPGGSGNWANNRPDWSRPDWGNRPNWNNNSNNNIINNNNNWINNNNWNTNINNWGNRPGWNNWNRPGYNNWNRPWYNHYTNWHTGWHHGYWNYWGNRGYPWVWYGLGATTAGWIGGDSYAYYNPYYVAPATTSTVVYYPDYSQPIAPPASPPAEALADSGAVDNSGAATDAAPAPDPGEEQASALMDSARDLFKQGNYQGALDKVNAAIQLSPSDTALHEFRALCLFALKQWKEAAATVYAVLSVGPGWDWETMKALYPSPSVYTAQLRLLEDAKKATPDRPELSFLLAYHYLVLGYPDNAVKELEQVVKLDPKDQLSAAILKALSQRGQPQAEQQPAPAG